MSFLWFIIIGIVAGYVAGKIMRGGGFGLIVNLVVGIIGGVLGGWLFSLLGIYSTGGIFLEFCCRDGEYRVIIFLYGGFDLQDFL